MFNSIVSSQDIICKFLIALYYFFFFSTDFEPAEFLRQPVYWLGGLTTPASRNNILRSVRPMLHHTILKSVITTRPYTVGC